MMTSTSVCASSPPVRTYCCSFFFKCYGSHRYLHSFPTRRSSDLVDGQGPGLRKRGDRTDEVHGLRRDAKEDRKSTRLNSSHVRISYAVFCLKKKTPRTTRNPTQARSLQPA